MVVVYKDRKTPRIPNDELEKFTFPGAHPEGGGVLPEKLGRGVRPGS